MSSSLRRTPAMIDILQRLLAAEHPLWGLQLSAATGRPTGTVYPLLERLEQAGFVSSTWESENDRPGPRRRLYALTPPGRRWATEQCSASTAGRSAPRAATA